MSSPEKVKSTLCQCISEFVSNPQNCLRDPAKNFKRRRKLPLEKMISSILQLGNGTLANELLDSFRFSVDMPTVSAFVQQRDKLLPTAFESIFQAFTKRTRQARLYKGLRLYAVDGSDLQIAANPNDPDSFYPSVNGAKPYSLLHLNVLFDLLSHTYVDAQIQKSHLANEHKAFVDIVDRLEDFFPVLIMADRGYESYNNLAHLQEKGHFFLIRVKDAASKQGITPGFSLPNEPFDRQFHLSLTRKQTNETKQLFCDKEHFRFVPSTSVFDFLPLKNKRTEPTIFYQLHFRLVRFEISDDHFETIITNLPEDRFSPNEIKMLYAMRWGIETSFRDLKYTIGLLHFHSKKVDYILQEIFARLIMYNFSELITSHVVIQNGNRLYEYKVCFSSAVHICKNFLFGFVDPPDVETLIGRFILPIRPNRSRARILFRKGMVSFTYRVA